MTTDAEHTDGLRGPETEVGEGRPRAKVTGTLGGKTLGREGLIYRRINSRGQTDCERSVTENLRNGPMNYWGRQSVSRRASGVGDA